MRLRDFHLDTHKLWFSAKALLVVALLFVGVRYGTVFAAAIILDDAEHTLVQSKEDLEKHLAARPDPTPEDYEIREKLQEFEETLSTRSIQGPSLQVLAQAHKRMIAADLSTMKLYLFDSGYATATIDILSKGKRGSRWETPTGLYKIETKELDHFSSIGAVHMPYSMQFFGNFYVHGWPYYPGGDPVPEGYSGGCIRLSTEDAARVYEFAKNGMPIFVWEDPANHEDTIEIGSVPLPRLSAKSYIIANIRTGKVYAERSADAPLPIASVTKLMTALVANETIHYDRLLSISSDDRTATDGTPGNLLLNELLTVGDALFALLLESNNSVAYTLARYNGMDNFLGWMNDKARAIGMVHTNFEDPSGISPNNVASASDLFHLMRYIHNSQSYILNMSREQSKTIVSESGSKYTLGNFNHYAGNPEFLGGKVGYTIEAKQTMTAVFEVPIKNSTTTATIAIVVLGSDDRKKDVTALVSWFKSTARVSEIKTLSEL